MKCQTCSVNLVMSDRQGIEIDYCPECRGVWLDRGELDKIIERSSDYQVRESSPNYDQKDQGSDYNKPKTHSYDERNRSKQKRGGLLGDLFDFGD